MEFENPRWRPAAILKNQLWYDQFDKFSMVMPLNYYCIRALAYTTLAKLWTVLCI